MIRAVSDTGPLLHLTEAQALDPLHLAGEVHTPQVVSEMMHLLPDRQTPTWITVDVLAHHYSAEAAAWLQAELLHAGEAEAIALARQIGADWLLTDDAAARLFTKWNHWSRRPERVATFAIAAMQERVQGQPCSTKPSPYSTTAASTAN